MDRKGKKSILLNIDEVMYSRFKQLCEDEGFNITIALNQIIKNSVKKQKLW